MGDSVGNFTTSITQIAASLAWIPAWDFFLPSSFFGLCSAGPYHCFISSVLSFPFHIRRVFGLVLFMVSLSPFLHFTQLRTLRRRIVIAKLFITCHRYHPLLPLPLPFSFAPFLPPLPYCPPLHMTTCIWMPWVLDKCPMFSSLPALPVPCLPPDDLLDFNLWMCVLSVQ